MPEFTHQLTHPHTEKFAYSISENINKDYPNAAIVRNVSGGFAVFLSKTYVNYCKRYVANNCNVKNEAA